MAKIRLCAGLFSLLLLLASTGWGLAQAPEAISIVGSGIVNSLIDRLAEASGTDSVDIRAIGTAAGIDEFCNGGIDLATATREMSDAERVICNSNDVDLSGLLIGHHIVAFIAQADAPLQCLQSDQVHEIFKPSATNALTDWSFASEEHADLPLTLLIPGEQEIVYFIVDSVVAGDGLRLDAVLYDDVSEAVNRVRETDGALAFIPWSDQVENNESVSLLEISGDDFGGCTLPSAEEVEGGRYDVAHSLYVYVNRARLDANGNLAGLMQYIVDQASATAIEAAGATPPSVTTYELNAIILADAEAIPGSGGDFELPTDLSGEIRIVGAANAHQVLSRVGDRLTAAYEQLSVSFSHIDMRSGIGRLCGGEADIAVLNGTLVAEPLESCAASGVVTMPLTIGAQATVLLGNVADAYSACLTTDQVNEIWRADTPAAVQSWSDVDDAFPDMQMTLFGLSFTDQYTDILLQTAAPIIPPVRRDTETDYDPLYRAAAVGNVTGGLTYMSWTEYQNVLDNRQANIQLVAIDGGSGCVQPSGDSIENGSYPLSRRASLLINEGSLAKTKVQSFLWSLADEDNWSMFEQYGFVGTTTLKLPIIRRDLLRWFAAAELRYPQADGMAESETEVESAEDDSAEAGSG